MAAEIHCVLSKEQRVIKEICLKQCCVIQLTTVCATVAAIGRGKKNEQECCYHSSPWESEQALEQSSQTSGLQPRITRRKTIHLEEGISYRSAMDSETQSFQFLISLASMNVQKWKTFIWANSLQEWCSVQKEGKASCSSQREQQGISHRLCTAIACPL